MTYSFKCSVARTRLTLIFKLHLSLLIHSTKTLSFSSIQNCTYHLHTYSRRQIMITALRRNELQRNAACKNFYDSTYSFKRSVARTRLTLVFKLHLSLLIHSTKTLSFSSIQNCTYHLHTYSRRQIMITALRRNELQHNAACKKL